MQAKSFNGIDFYSHNVWDAIGLAYASMEESETTIVHRADFHIADIKQYKDFKSDKRIIKAINTIKSLKKAASEYLNTRRSLLKDLGSIK